MVPAVMVMVVVRKVMMVIVMIAMVLIMVIGMMLRRMVGMMVVFAAMVFTTMMLAAVPAPMTTATVGCQARCREGIQCQCCHNNERRLQPAYCEHLVFPPRLDQKT